METRDAEKINPQKPRRNEVIEVLEKEIKENLADERTLKIEIENYEAKIKTSCNKLEEIGREIKKTRHKLEMLLLNAINLCR
jgi:archaellum component FlaC